MKDAKRLPISLLTVAIGMLGAAILGRGLILLDANMM